MSEMVKKPKPSGHDTPTPTPTPNWLNLPEGITESIFGRLRTIELLEKVQFTCPNWYRICKSAKLWVSIEMKPSLDAHAAVNCHSKYVKLGQACRSAVDRSCGEIQCVDVEYFCDDELLEYITDRCHKIKSLRFAGCGGIMDQGLINVLPNLALLEELEITECEVAHLALQALGKACPKLETFKLCTEWGGKYDEVFEVLRGVKDDDEASAIANSMRGLKNLQLIGNTVTNKGLKEILGCCTKLISLDVRQCFHLDMDRELISLCAGICTLRLPDDSISDEEFLASLG